MLSAKILNRAIYMRESPSGRGTIRFLEYEVDLPAGQLLRQGRRVRLREQSFKVLALLLEHAGEVVTREELRRRLWPGDVFVDFDNNLNSAVAHLREALRDSAEHPRFIETLPKHGYRFIASISSPARTSEPVPERKARIVVLPFLNLNGDAVQEYFSDAVTEEFITCLARLSPERLGVIARTTAMHYKGSQKDVAGIARELGVEYVVEGSARRTNDQIQMNVQLIRAIDQTHIWADRYDTESRELFGTENAAARAIAGQIGITPKDTARKPTEDLLAYNLYIQGRYNFGRATPEGVPKAKQFFEQAIARAPDFALAYDSLAELYWYLGFAGLMPPKQACSIGIQFVLRAVELDSSLAETHALLAMYRRGLEFVWPEVQREMDLALQLDPASPIVRHRYAVHCLLPHGRMEEAAVELKRALESDPLSPSIRMWLVTVLWLGGQYDQAIKEARILLELDPTGYASHATAGMAFREKGMFDEAIPLLRRAVELSGGATPTLGFLGLALAQSGKADEARALLDRLHQIARERYVPPTSLAWIHLGLGETDDAFIWLDRAVDAGDQMMTPIKTYSFFDPLRGDPRFHTLLRKMNLEA